MAPSAAPSASLLHSFLSVAQATLFDGLRTPRLGRVLPIALPAFLIPIPSTISQIWDGLLHAVPKKKTSHMKKRHRFMAGKALKDVTAMNKCSSCGRVKLAHLLCPYCVNSVRQWIRGDWSFDKEMKPDRSSQGNGMSGETRRNYPLTVPEPEPERFRLLESSSHAQASSDVQPSSDVRPLSDAQSPPDLQTTEETIKGRARA